MPSFASDPPATTATRSWTPDATSAPATIKAWTGPAQNAFTSAPLASVSPVASAIALARLPAAALVAVAHRLLAARDHVRDRGRDRSAASASRNRVAWTALAMHARFSSRTDAVSDSSCS